MNIITPEIEAEAAAYAEITVRFSKHNLIEGYRVHAEVCKEHALDFQQFCEQILGIKQREYQVAFVKEDGSFDVVQRIVAGSDWDANNYALHAYAGRKWHLLDENGNDIHGDDQ